MKKHKVIWAIVIVAVVIISALAFVYFSAVENYKRNVESIQVHNVDLGTISDGEYLGDCDVDFVQARVRVVVKDHIITELEILEHKNGRGAAAEILPSKIIAQQRIDVEIISGATSSSKVIQEAVYNALTGKHTFQYEN